MIHLKYKYKVHFMKLPVIWIDLCLNMVFGNATAGCNTGCRSVVNCASCSLQLPLTVSDVVCGIENATKKCILRFHLHTVNKSFSSIPIQNNPVGLSIETWLANCRGATSDPSPTETTVQEISNFTWKVRRSSVMLNINTTSFIQRHNLQKSRQFLLQKSELRLSCKTTFQDERSDQLIVQNCAPHIDTKT